MEESGPIGISGALTSRNRGYHDQVMIRTLDDRPVTLCKLWPLRDGSKVAMRPEGTDDGGYREVAQGYDADAWHEFTPFRVGDAPSGGGEYSPPTAADGVPQDGRGRGWGQRDHAGDRGTVPTGSDAPENGDRRSGSWWTESSPGRLNSGDNVRATRCIGSEFFSHVQPGTAGRVVDRTTTWLGEDRLTIDFANGYTERDVAPDAVERRGWLG